MLKNSRTWCAWSGSDSERIPPTIRTIELAGYCLSIASQLDARNSHACQPLWRFPKHAPMRYGASCDRTSPLIHSSSVDPIWDDVGNDASDPLYLRSSCGVAGSLNLPTNVW